ncbi:hypothetical protein Tco_0837405 [Tanacetum coccineum]
MPPKKRTTRTSPATTTTTSTPMTYAQIQALIERGVAAALAEHDADRSRNGDDIYDLGTGERRQVSTVLSSLKASLITREMLPNTSLILELFCDELKELITHFIPMISFKLLVQHISNYRYGKRISLFYQHMNVHILLPQ